MLLWTTWIYWVTSLDALKILFVFPKFDFDVSRYEVLSFLSENLLRFFSIDKYFSYYFRYCLHPSYPPIFSLPPFFSIMRLFVCSMVSHRSLRFCPFLFILSSFCSSDCIISTDQSSSSLILSSSSYNLPWCLLINFQFQLFYFQLRNFYLLPIFLYLIFKIIIWKKL